MSSPGTSQPSDTLTRESNRQRLREIVLAVINQDLPSTPEEQQECHLILAIIDQDIAEDLKTLHINEEGPAPAPSDTADSNDALSAALAMGMFVSRIFKFHWKATGSDRLFRQDTLSNMRCAVQIADNPVMGNPFSPTPGWDLKVDLDPGVLAQPSIGFHFRFSKDGSDSKSIDHDNAFSLGWEPCLKVGGRWMMEDPNVVKATSSLRPDVSKSIFPKAIQELCTKREDLDRLYFAVFCSNVHKSSKMSPEWAKALRGDGWKAPYANLQRMCASGEPKYFVKIWFLNPHPTVERLFHGCLAPLYDAVNDHKPPFSQYFHETARPVEALDCSESSDDPDALRADNLRLKSDNSSLQSLLQDQNEKIRKLADDLRQARKESDAIVQAAEGIKHHKDLKPNELQKALNAIAKILR